MKLKLNEAVKPLDKYKRNIDRGVLPTLEKAGFTLPKNPTETNEYLWHYKGYYNSPAGNSIPVDISFSTASDLIDEEIDNAFMSMTIAGNAVDIGGVDLKDPQTIIDGINILIDQGDIKEPSTFADDLAAKDSELIPARNNSKMLTKEQWKRDFMSKYSDYNEAWNYFNTHRDDPEAEAQWDEVSDYFNREYIPHIYPDDKVAIPEEYYKQGKAYNDRQAFINLQNDIASGKELKPEDPFSRK